MDPMEWNTQKHNAKRLNVQSLHDRWRTGGEVRFQDRNCTRVITARPVAKKSKKLKGTGDWDHFMKAVVTERRFDQPGQSRVTTMLDFMKGISIWREPLPEIKKEAVAPPVAVGDKRPADGPAEDSTAEKRLQLTTGDQAVPNAGLSGAAAGGTGDGAGPSGAGGDAGGDTGGDAGGDAAAAGDVDGSLQGGYGDAGGVDDDDDVGPEVEELGGQKLGVLRQAFADTWATISGPMLTAQDLKRALQQMAEFKDTVTDQSSALDPHVVHMALIADTREAIKKPTEPGLVITIDD